MGFVGDLLGPMLGSEDPSGMGGTFGLFPTGTTPQMMGYGIPDPAPFEAYQTGPGLQQGTPIEGLDMSQAGPGAAESFWDQMQGRFTAPDVGQSTNRAEEAYQAFRGTPRDLPPDAGLSEYYNRAVETGTGDINKQLAARGLYGSKEGIQQISDLDSALRAEEANRSADYRLRADAANQAAAGLTGSLAGGADASSRQGSQNELSWLQGGMGAAQAAQDARRGRTQDFFNNTLLPAQMNAGMTMSAMDNILGADQDLFNNSLMFGTGLAEDLVNRSDRQQQQIREGAQDFMSLGASGMLGGGMKKMLG